MNTLPLKPTPLCGANCVNTAHATHAGMADQVKEFFLKLFNTADWPPRWLCGNWSDFHGWLYIFSDLLIWACYFTLPVLLFFLLKRRKDIPFTKVVWLFICFIILCGATHLLDAIIFWWPAYRLSALLRLITGIVSAAAVVGLYKTLPRIHSLRTVNDLEAEIAERKGLEKRLAQSEFMLAEAGRMGKMGAWEIDLITFETVWSRMIYDIYELPYDYDTSLHDIDDYFLEPYNQILKSVIDRAVAEGTAWDIDLQILTAKKNLKWVRSYGEPLYNRTGDVTKLRGVFIDIERFKNTELSLNKSMEMVSQNNMQLKSFTHILSHNIRNHASNIALISSMINEDTLDEHNKELFDKIKKVSAGLNTTLTDLSEAIKVRESVLTAERLSFSEVTKQVLEVIGTDVKAHNAKIETQFSVEYVDFPRAYLESIILNLLTNAIKYRKPGVDPQIILKTYIGKKHKVVFECTDNGLGIDLEKYGDKIFGLYKTFHNHAAANGVGLFLIKIQIESQGGEIEVDSTPDAGSSFKVTFNE
ncbi:MAG: PAS domain-containing sensor histidine kinase [Mucilaginibacter sp.]